MGERITYYEDFYAWSQHYAAVLRELARRRDLPNDLDIEHVAEEIEDVGNAELNSVRGFLRLMLAHMIKVASLPGSDPARHWFEEVAAFHIELFTFYSKSMRQRIDAQEAWELAIRQAEAGLRRYDEQVIPGLPERCPFSVDELIERDST